MTRGLLWLHRSLGVAMLGFWLIQAVVGCLLVFRWEIEDALLPGTAAEAKSAALGERVEAITRAGGHAIDLWATAGAATRFDIYYVDAAGTDRIMRVDGAGEVLRDVADSGWFANGAVFDTLTEVHTQLLVGESGSWIVAASGLLLFTQLVAGLGLAWPRAGGWRHALLPPTSKAPAARLFGWHRALGLGLGLLIPPFVAAGLLLCFEAGLRERLGGEIPLPVASTDRPEIGAGEALAIAASHNPQSKLSALILPSEGRPWFHVRQLRPGDMSRNWGTSTLFVSAVDGRILGDYPSAQAPIEQRLVEAIYPFHTGQLAGVAGRAFVLLQGFWLIAMILIGLQLWRARRAGR